MDTELCCVALSVLQTEGARQDAPYYCGGGSVGSAVCIKDNFQFPNCTFFDHNIQNILNSNQVFMDNYLLDEQRSIYVVVC